MNIRISFLIPVFNQQEELFSCISRIVAYPGDDIEIVVSDDNSTDDLGAIISKFNDERIRHYKNRENLGLDGNILFGLDFCQGEFVFLLRTRDYIIADAIHDIIAVIDKFPNVAYISGTCLDEDNLPHIICEERLYKKGIEAFEAHDTLHFHPSGSAFKREWIDKDILRKYYDLFEEPRVWFLINHLLRLHLATKGDFYVISKPIWIYSQRYEKPSVHKIKNIYDQRYTFLRYRSEMQFIHDEIEDCYKAERYIKCFETWLRNATLYYYIAYTDEDTKSHYGYVTSTEIDIEKERKGFIHFSEEVERTLSITDDMWGGCKKNIIDENVSLFEYWKHAQERKEYIKSVSEKALLRFQDAFNDDIRCREWLDTHGVRSVGIYGSGYLGRIILKDLKRIDSIKVKSICDKKYPFEMMIGKDTWAIPPKDISKHSVDICIISPIQYFDEIRSEIEDRVRCISIEDFLV